MQRHQKLHSIFSINLWNTIGKQLIQQTVNWQIFMQYYVELFYLLLLFRLLFRWVAPSLLKLWRPEIRSFWELYFISVQFVDEWWPHALGRRVCDALLHSDNENIISPAGDAIYFCWPGRVQCVPWSDFFYFRFSNECDPPIANRSNVAANNLEIVFIQAKESDWHRQSSAHSS
jgi:hypothetical protein